MGGYGRYLVEKALGKRAKMDFGEAIRILKRDGEVYREGWNGKGMFIFMLDFSHPNRAHRLKPCIAMFTAQGEVQPGWLASQADILAEDWIEKRPSMLKGDL